MIRSLTLATAFFSALFLSAQVVILHDVHGNQVNGQTIVEWGAINMYVMEVDVEATLSTGPDRPINMKRYELSVEAGTHNYFCWGVCYAAQDAGALPVWYAQPQHAITMAENVAVTNFHAYHEPDSVFGTGLYRYVWYDVANPSDTAWVDIQFEVTGVGIEEVGSGVRTFEVYPNPTAGGDVQFQWDIAGPATNLELVVHNMLGERVMRKPLGATQNKTSVTTEGLSAGVYFASLEQKGSALATKRFAVTAR